MAEVPPCAGWDTMGGSTGMIPDPGNLNAPFVEDLYQRYLDDPQSLSPDWRNYFDRLSRSRDRAALGLAQPAPPAEEPAATPADTPLSGYAPVSRAPGRRLPAGNGETAAAPAMRSRPGLGGGGSVRQDRVNQLIRAYRVRGHVVADIDPLGRPRPEQPELDPAYYGFSEADLDRQYSTESLGRSRVMSLRQILQLLRATYTHRIGVEFMHIQDPQVRLWLQRRMESTANSIELPRDVQVRILTRLTDAVIFEQFIQKKFLGAKSFSLEGAESLIPLLDLAIEKAAHEGISEIVLGMPHRGRLNVLANIMDKSPRQIFREFQDYHHGLDAAPGDVKYHLGHSTDRTIDGKKIHLSLCFNPSHLEYIDPVALGRLRAKQDFHDDRHRKRGMALLIHGDAAFIGEGVVQETLNLSQLAGYTVGGTLHVIVNNQVGFTTPPEEGRSSLYASDVAKMLQIPIFHVNGEFPEAVAQVVNLALDFRRQFRRDVVVDMYCFRRRGHNEGDEPAFTQPVMQRLIEARPDVRDRYLEHLLPLGGVTREEAQQIAQQRLEHLQQEMAVVEQEPFVAPQRCCRGLWEGKFGGPSSAADNPQTGVPLSNLSALLEAQTHLPEAFQPHPKIIKAIALRRQMAAGQRPLDWSAAESLAIASLAVAGIPVRMTGQDTARGTFSQRHAVLHDVQTGETYLPLAHLRPEQARVEIVNSPLSEIAVLGFEYGYSLDYPNALVLWEAQFGDFANAAQVIIDQFIAAAEAKWRRLSAIVLLLPHGFEGQGPEHSSARLERFLTLAAQDNLQVVVPSTAGQYFHVLRRQALRAWRKPLILLTPKSLLRLPRAASTLAELGPGTHFEELLLDPDPELSAQARRVLLCSGKVYYDLLAHREKTGRNDVAILRLEQLYPLPQQALEQALERCPAAVECVWVQEEPENMGALHYLRWTVDAKLGPLPWRGLSRAASASTGTGSAARHKHEQEQLLEAAFA